MPVEKSGQDEFDFQYGDDFGAHIESVRPGLLQGARPLQPRRRRRDEPAPAPRGSSGSPTGCTSTTASSSSSCSCRPSDEQLESVGGDTDRYDAELRPELMRRAIEEIQDFGIEVDIWKIEGVDERADAEMLAEQTRKGEGREGVVCVLLGRGARDEKVDHWLRAAAPVEGFIGFAIGRSIWWDALKGFLDGGLDARRGRRADRRQLPALHPRLRGAGERGRVADRGSRRSAARLRTESVTARPARRPVVYVGRVSRAVPSSPSSSPPSWWRGRRAAAADGARRRELARARRARRRRRHDPRARSAAATSACATSASTRRSRSSPTRRCSATRERASGVQRARSSPAGGAARARRRARATATAGCWPTSTAPRDGLFVNAELVRGGFAAHAHDPAERRSRRRSSRALARAGAARRAAGYGARACSA